MKYKKFYKAVSAYLKEGDFFVNLGANDGVTNDPVFEFIKPFSLKGIAVEPVEVTYKSLCNNYRDLPGVVCERAAVYSGTIRPLYRLRDDLLAQEPVLSQGTSMDRDQLLKLLQDLKDGHCDPTTYEKIGRNLLDSNASVESLLVVDDSVLYMTFDALMKKHGVEKVDFLNIDIEGYDYPVFMDLDLPRWQPKVIVIETRLFSVDEMTAFSCKMQENGYRFLQRFDYFSEVYARSW